MGWSPRSLIILLLLANQPIVILGLVYRVRVSPFTRLWPMLMFCLWSVFPGALIPTLTFLISTLSSGSQGRFVADSVSNIGPHYARTLREWRRRFESKFEGIVVPGLRKEFAARTGLDGNNLSRDDIEFFKRKWICECFAYAILTAFIDHVCPIQITIATVKLDLLLVRLEVSFWCDETFCNVIEFWA